MPTKVKVSELGLGDQIQVVTGLSYATATVYRIDEDGYHIWLPYVHTGDVVYGSGHPSISLIPYIGVEDFPLALVGEVILVRKNPDKLK